MKPKRIKKQKIKVEVFNSYIKIFMFINTIPEEKIKLVDSLDLTLRSNKKVERGFSSKIVEIFVQKKTDQACQSKDGAG